MPEVQLTMRKILKKYTSNRTRRNLALALVDARRPTARWRPLPSLLVIGAQRSGTSSLFKYLGGHPECGPSIRKEIRYFTEFYGKGVDWYRSHFPMKWWSRSGPERVTFEATPDYLLDPRVPARVKACLPEVKVLVLLRDPVERAYSHYWHNRRLGTESLSFEDAIAGEADRIGPYLEVLKTGYEGPTHKSFLRYSYLERGRYATQLQVWLGHVGPERMLVLNSEEFYKETDLVYQRILSFLGLREWRPETYRNFSYTTNPPVIPPLGPQIRAQLEGEFEAELNRLGDLLAAEWGETVGWAVPSRRQ